MGEIKSIATVNQRADREISIDEVKLGNIISHFSGLIERGHLPPPLINHRTVVEKALSLALLAMTEAEKELIGNKRELSN